MAYKPEHEGTFSVDTLSGLREHHITQNAQAMESLRGLSAEEQAAAAKGLEQAHQQWLREQADLQTNTATAPTTTQAFTTAAPPTTQNDDAMFLAQMNQQRKDSEAFQTWSDDDSYDYLPSENGQELKKELDDLLKDRNVTDITADGLAASIGQKKLSDEQIAYVEQRLDERKDIKFDKSFTFDEYGQDTPKDKLSAQMDAMQIAQQREQELQQQRQQQQELAEQQRLEREEQLRQQAENERRLKEGLPPEKPDMDTKIVGMIPGMTNLA